MSHIQLNDLTPTERELLSQCGADAQGHPLELNGGVLRFRADPFALAIQGMVDLNELWKQIEYLLPSQEVRLSLRKYYRDIGYSLCGYIEIFGDMLEKEESALSGAWGKMLDKKE